MPQPLFRIYEREQAAASLSYGVMGIFGPAVRKMN
jgi:hypothetical protein